MILHESTNNTVWDWIADDLLIVVQIVPLQAICQETRANKRICQLAFGRQLIKTRHYTKRIVANAAKVVVH